MLDRLEFSVQLSLFLIDEKLKKFCENARRTNKKSENHGISNFNQTGVLRNASSDPSLHHSLCFDDHGRPTGPSKPVSTVLQSSAGMDQVPVLANVDHLPVLRHIWLQFLLQYDLYLPVLPNVGGKFVPGTNSGFCDNVYFWKCFHDLCRLLCQSTLPRYVKK